MPELDEGLMQASLVTGREFCSTRLDSTLKTQVVAAAAATAATVGSNSASPSTFHLQGRALHKHVKQDDTRQTCTGTGTSTGTGVCEVVAVAVAVAVARRRRLYC
ncbi:hypothetical protein CLCR_02684 [Cladophialophora carrionii]|uniref:Uncharacterized protein n=1 Tax=Cladophialophora carrionii TaxID=86049 RepID=A0A1C1CFG2_9EURO|nr:hypothetical protein CLCR_02684 [Cladophialophora carrionii]